MGDGQQSLSDQVKHPPQQHKAQSTLHDESQPGRPVAVGPPMNPDCMGKAGIAQHAVFVLGDTLPAEELTTLGAARHCLATGVVAATLPVDECRRFQRD
jgi:hypothetical protein